MNTIMATYSEHSWSRRSSTETIFSIQGKETDFVRDTSDTSESEGAASDAERDVEYEPVTEPEDDGPVDGDTSEQSDKDIIKTRVIEVSVGEECDLELADSEQTDTYESDSEMDFNDYWHCAQCRADNNNPLYRYCQKCFQVRKTFFPPRPKRKHKPVTITEDTIPRTLSQDSGVEMQCSQLASPEYGEGTSQTDCVPNSSKFNAILGRNKRRGESADRRTKRARKSFSDTESDTDTGPVQPLVKTLSDPSITIEDTVKLTKKVIANTLKEKLKTKDLCIVCLSEPKSGIFVHGRIAHICCCYKCAVKVWAKAKRCPVCNCKVSNVLQAVVM